MRVAVVTVGIVLVRMGQLGVRVPVPVPGGPVGAVQGGGEGGGGG